MVTEGKDLKGSSLVNFELYVNPLEHPEKDLVVKASVQPLMIVYDEVIRGGAGEGPSEMGSWEREREREREERREGGRKREREGAEKLKDY